MWSGPRNISTAMMRAWGNRPDTFVIDEPFYACYLKATGKKHPGADEVIAAGRARTLEPAEHLETEVRFIAFEGISSVAEVGSDGIVRGED